MKKILIIGDTHRQDIITRSVIEDEQPFDLLLHTGDAEGSESFIESIAEAPCRFVSGNCDYTSYPIEEELRIGPYRALLTHGHTLRLKSSPEAVASDLKAKGYDILIHGHTHIPVAEYKSGLLVLSPGSLAYPRQEGRRRTYLVLLADEKGSLNYELKSV